LDLVQRAAVAEQGLLAVHQVITLVALVVMVFLIPLQGLQLIMAVVAVGRRLKVAEELLLAVLAVLAAVEMAVLQQAHRELQTQAVVAAALQVVVITVGQVDLAL